MDGRIFTKKQFWTLLLFILLLIGCWAVFAFLIKEESISRVSLWADMVFGTGSIITSCVAIGISVLALRREESLRKQKIEENANKFISDNNDELLYIPLCLVANALNNHHKYERKIYNAFNVLDRETQKEVLKQLNYDFELIDGNSWIDKGIDKIKSFIKTNDLGRDLLYDDAKYFHGSVKYQSSTYRHPGREAEIMPDYFGWTSKLIIKLDKRKKPKLRFGSYLEAYIDAKKANNEVFSKHKEDKPIDVFANVINFGRCSDEQACYWTMELVLSIALYLIRNHYNNNDETIFLSSGDARIDTYEDRYLDVLIELYNLDLVSRK